MQRRRFISAAVVGCALPQVVFPQAARVKLGIDLFSLRSQNRTPMQHLDYCAKQQAKVVHFSEIRFIGGLETGRPTNSRGRFR
jgi:hypothetical protein